MAKDPLAADDIGARRPGNQCLGAVPLKSIELFLHRGKLVRVMKGCMSSRRKRGRLPMEAASSYSSLEYRRLRRRTPALALVTG